MLQLPTELLLEIVPLVNNPSDLLHFALTCRVLSPFFLDELYRRDVQDWNCSALLWACRTGSVVTARRSLDAGAAVDHSFFKIRPADCSAWPPWVLSFHEARASCLAGRPLAIAVQHRHVALVRFLLEEKGADPNRDDDTWSVSHHEEGWFPIHWAVSCQTPLTTNEEGQNDENDGGSSSRCQTDEEKQHQQRQQQCCGFPSNSNPPPNPEIVALLLRHGADPNQATTIRTPDDYYDRIHQEGIRPLHLTGCDHVPPRNPPAPARRRRRPPRPERLLGLPPVPSPRLHGGLRCWQRTLFENFRPLWPFGSEASEAKLLLAARHGGEDRRRWRFDQAATTSTLHILTPSRLRTLLFLTGSNSREESGCGPVVLASGVFPLLEAWSRQKAATLDAARQDPRSDDAVRQAETLDLLERLIARLVGVSRIEYSDEAVLIDRECELLSAKNKTQSESPASASASASPRQEVGVFLAEAFHSFCANAKDTSSSDDSPFIAILAEHGVRPQREGRQLTLSEAVERRLVPKSRSLLREWPRDLVLGWHTDFGLYRRDVDSRGVVRFYLMGIDEEARQEAERRMLYW
ncbi:ion channel nompc [Apiospora sp. TS-2023a]